MTLFPEDAQLKMLKNESSYKSVANAKPKLWHLKAQKLPIFAMKRDATQKLAV